MANQFSGGRGDSIVLPSLREFLRITQLSHYESKFKKLKCCEVEDTLRVLSQAGLKNVEEQRVRRYVNHFQTRNLTEPTTMEQPTSLEDFFRATNLKDAHKHAIKLGVAEFDDLSRITYADLNIMLPKKVECERFKRYVTKFTKQREQGMIQPDPIDLSSFLMEAQLKSYKKAFEKLGVADADDLHVLARSDFPKMTQVEYDRFVRYRHEYRIKNEQRRAEEEAAKKAVKNEQRRAEEEAAKKTEPKTEQEDDPKEEEDEPPPLPERQNSQNEHKISQTSERQNSQNERKISYTAQLELGDSQNEQTPPPQPGAFSYTPQPQPTPRPHPRPPSSTPYLPTQQSFDQQYPPSQQPAQNSSQLQNFQHLNINITPQPQPVHQPVTTPPGGHVPFPQPRNDIYLPQPHHPHPLPRSDSFQNYPSQQPVSPGLGMHMPPMTQMGPGGQQQMGHFNQQPYNPHYNPSAPAPY